MYFTKNTSMASQIWPEDLWSTSSPISHMYGVSKALGLISVLKPGWPWVEEMTLGREHAGSFTAQAGRRRIGCGCGIESWSRQQGHCQKGLGGFQSCASRYPSGRDVVKRSFLLPGREQDWPRSTELWEKSRQPARGRDDDGPHSVCGVSFSMNKSTSYLSLLSTHWIPLRNEAYQEPELH